LLPVVEKLFEVIANQQQTRLTSQLALLEKIDRTQLWGRFKDFDAFLPPDPASHRPIGANWLSEAPSGRSGFHGNRPKDGKAPPGRVRRAAEALPMLSDSTLP
jgi:hypothetical protein